MIPQHFQYDGQAKKIKALEDENAVLREALEFYANYDNYCDFTDGIDDVFHKIGGGFEASSDADTGEIARAALYKSERDKEE